MKKFITILGAGLFLFSCGEATNVVAEVSEEINVGEVQPIQVVDGFDHYGIEAVPVESAISMDDFSEAFANDVTANYTVTTELASVCTKAGCFAIVDMPNQSQMRVMFKDHFTIPTDTEVGTMATFTGEAKMDTTSIADLQHYIKDEMAGDNVSEERKAELQMKHDAITEPEIEPVFIASGILVKG